MSADSRAAERDRRAQANRLNAAAQRYYHDYWDVRHIADVELEAGEFSHRDEEKSALQLLEYADVDVIVDTNANAQIFVQEKFVQASTNGDCLLIRVDNGSETIPSEAAALRSAVDDPAAFSPGVFGYGRARTPTEFRWYWLVDVDQFVREWMAGDIAPTEGVYRNPDGTESLMFPPDQIAHSDAVMAAWGETPARLTRLDDPPTLPTREGSL